MDELIRQTAARVARQVAPESVDRQREKAMRIYRERIKHRRGSGRVVRSWVPIAAVAAVLVLALFALRGPREASLVAKVGDRPFAAGAVLYAKKEPLALEFSDRSQVSLAPKTEMRLIRSGPEYVQIGLGFGHLDLSIPPGGPRRWSVDAGSYTVEVTGTEFAVTWLPASHSLTVDVTDGSVLVRGSEVGEDGLRLSAGQRRHFGGAMTAALAVPGTPAAGAATNTTTISEDTPPPGPRMDWHALCERGRPVEAIIEAERAGFKALTRRLSVAELDDLITCARLASDFGRALEALLVLRQRFPAGARAQGATYLLGRVALESKDLHAAAGWFQTYLDEQPEGPLMEQAHGRLMEIWRELGDVPRARRVAAAYLQRHPEGEFADDARRILDAQ